MGDKEVRKQQIFETLVAWCHFEDNNMIIVRGQQETSHTSVKPIVLC